MADTISAMMTSERIVRRSRDFDQAARKLRCCKQGCLTSVCRCPPLMCYKIAEN